MKRLGGGAQVKLGAIFSYILIILNTLYSIVLVPFIVEQIGDTEYGVFKSISSLSSAMMVLDLGLGSTMMRYIAKFRADGDNHKIAPFVSMATCEAFILSIITAVACLGFYFNIGGIYKESFTNSEIELAKKLFLILSINVVVHVFSNLFNGVITGHNNFLFGNGIKIIRIVVRVIATLTVFVSFKSALALVAIDLIITVIVALVEFVYILARYKIKPVFKVKTWDKAIFKESFIYTLLIFAASLLNQVESNFANIIVGAFKGPELVTVFSFGIIIYGMFKQLSSAISHVMLPTITNVLNQEDGDKKAEQMMINIGRIQFVILFAMVIGFIVLGKEFVSLWLGVGYEDVYVICLILIIPAMFELTINVGLSILRAKNLVKHHTIITSISCLLNLAVSIVCVIYISYIGAAIGCLVSNVFVCISLGIVYKKKLGYNLIKIYLKIFSRIWLCSLIGGAVIYFTNIYLNGSWLMFIINVLIFGVVYVALLLLFGLKKEEKLSLPIIRRFYKKRKQECEDTLKQE